MQTCRKLLSLGLLFCASYAVPQSTARRPAIPQTNIIVSPQMPQISTPTLGSGFYTPGKTQAKSPAQQNNSPAVNNSIPSLSDFLAQSQDISSSLANNLSAQDMKTLQNAGMLSNLFEGTFSNGSTATLNGLLNKMNLLKNGSLNPNVLNTATNPSDLTSKLTVHEPKILRFTINGQNILKSCSTIYFSQPQKDGSFLLTADRKYQNGSKINNETFYMLFTKNTKKTSTYEYIVQPSVTQKTKDTSSLLYKLSDNHSLTAQKTGNLFYIKHSENGWNLDLLIDLGTIS